MPLNDAVGLARIAYSVVFLLKLAGSLEASELVWAHRRPPALRLLAGVLVAATVLLALGLLSGPAALASWLLYVILWRYASLYCLEDVLLQALAFYFVFAAPGSGYSLDGRLGVPQLWGHVPGAEACLTAVSGAILLSGGLEKLRSPLWRAGDACGYFFRLPNVRRIDASFVGRRRWLAAPLNYLTIAFEFGYLPAMLLQYRPLGAAAWLLASLFTLSLIVAFVVHWIGEAQLIMLGLAGWLLVHSPFPSLAHEPFGLLGWTILPALWTVLRLPGKPLKILSRFTWGTLPVSAFSELHLKGPVVYQVLDAATRRTAWPIFNADSTPGPARSWRPTFFETMAYKVTDVCMELDAYGEVRTPERLQFIQRLSEYARRKSPGSPDRLLFRIAQINPPEDFGGAAVDGFEVSFADGRALPPRPLAKPILRHETGRTLERVVFGFKA